MHWVVDQVLTCVLPTVPAVLRCAVIHAGEVATVWAFNYFFYNKKMKRILYIGVKAVSKTAAEEEKVSRQLFTIC